MVQIIPMLEDKGEFLASESSLYRILHAHGQQQHREKSSALAKRAKPKAHEATGPKQVWSSLGIPGDYLLDRDSKKTRISGPKGKARKVFEDVSRLPRHRQKNCRCCRALCRSTLK
jgi:hypothetical protein